MPFIPPGTARQAEGYSKEVFGQTDATTLPVGITEIGGTQLPGNTAGTGNTIAELFAAILVELRQMNANLVSLREPYSGYETKLRITA